ncbi:mechanosensitive ion channel family protein [Halalkalicoccus jeotgali]|uniref:Mechanosensitive ion channel MscS n=1 Tax=Halalkalicoccus jeotgali (strain DSM 18796 / CECT 7217 / JCM 14584 / KCTC 4019 / B3) TaxID=795797 RepID=D8J302_HALJB|nr:mechanosensitive ion channel family protein [Halalkalicoccus jeotgali]ADJ15109.1 MscS Mechanosensitive ion channel [Halalkalicoccus jeotgali B3]ELY34871.1 mechanosensitive ion channel MscS [Halalkalicoccus jeotgali B3]
MNELLAGLDVLAERYPAVPTRIAITLLAIGVVSLVSWSVARLRRFPEDEVHSTVVDLAGSIVIAGSLVGATAVVIGVWGQASTVAFALARANVDTATFGRLLLTVGLFAGTLVFVRFLRGLISELLSGHETVSEHQLEVTYRLTQIGSYILAVLVALGLWNVDLSGLLIGAGVLGAILGLAAQQTLASIFAGFVLMFSRPFEIGDWIEISDQEGIVSDITIVSTRIQTFDGEYVIVPNDEVSAQTINNRSKKGRLRLRVPVGVDYDTDLDRAESVIREAIDDLELLMRVPTPQIVVTEFGDSSIDFEVRFWIDKPSARRRWRAKQAVIKAINAAFDREDVSIPFPQRELSGRHGTFGNDESAPSRAAEGDP